MTEWSVPGYAELKELGSGGFGTVVLARHHASGVLVAIKYLRGELLDDPVFAEMFRDEATALSSVQDPNVVRFYEYVEAPEGAAIVMELVEGVSLREILSHQGSTTPEAALAVLHGSLLGLAAAHVRGVVHRDYKPENVLVDGEGASKLTDFGLAARAGDHPIAAGTLRYVAPEQIVGGQASPAADVYAATATFYECLAGHPPFTGEPDELIRQHQADPVPLDPLPPPLRPLVTAGMAKDPATRPADAAAFVTELASVAWAAYGQDWERRGRSHLGEAALLLAALWPAGSPPAVQGTTVREVRLRRHSGLRHLSPVKVVIAAAVAVAAAAAGTALAATTASPRPAGGKHPAAAVQPVSLQPTPTPSATGPAPTPSPVSPTASPTPSEPTPTPTPSGPAPSSPGTGPSPVGPSPPTPPVPVITSVRTYTSGVEVWFSIVYSDSANDAEGFGFVGVNGSGWAQEQHPFSSPSYGIVGPDSIAYPFNLGCGTGNQQAQSYVEAWIYDTTGARSKPVVIKLVCAGTAE